MPAAITAPRINNNDDQVRLIALDVSVGDEVTTGQHIAQVETDKAVYDVEASEDGFVIAILAECDQMIDVGSVLVWLGASVDEVVPEPESIRSASSTPTSMREPTAKAKRMLKEHGLTAAEVPSSGDRLSAADVAAFVEERETPPAGTSATSQRRAPASAGQLRDLIPEERAMLQTVSWHRDHAVAGYVEIEYDSAGWQNYGDAFAREHSLMMAPTLSLMSYALAKACQEKPALNATIMDNRRYEYEAVNLGFTVQAGDTLYLTVVRDAGTMGELGFVNALGELQRRAMSRTLGPEETSGATASFSSMARWKVSRHVPVLPPHTAILIAHAESSSGQPVLGATYDHRVLSGYDAVSLLRQLSQPRK